MENKINKYITYQVKRIFDIAGDELKILLITKDELLEKKENVKTFKPCKCGNYNLANEACLCQAEEVLNWRRNIKNMVKKYDLIFETDYIYDVFEYIKELEIEEEAKKLLTEAVKRFKLNLSSLLKVLKIAEKIKRIDKKEKITMQVIAESLQYYKFD